MVAHFGIRSAHRIRTCSTILIIFIRKLSKMKSKLTEWKFVYSFRFELNFKAARERANCFAQFRSQTNRPRNVQLFIVCDVHVGRHQQLNHIQSLAWAIELQPSRIIPIGKSFIYFLSFLCFIRLIAKLLKRCVNLKLNLLFPSLSFFLLCLSNWFVFALFICDCWRCWWCHCCCCYSAMLSFVICDYVRTVFNVCRCFSNLLGSIFLM